MTILRHTALLALLLLAAAAWGQRVTFSHQGGYYDNTFSLTLSAPAGYTVHYSLNGSEPTATSAAYTSPLRLTRECYSHSDIYKIPNAPDGQWSAPDSVEHIIVVRAALFDSQGVRRSAVATQTYLIGSLMGRRTGLPVVSLCADSTDLFDYDSGIFVPGRHYNPDDPYPHRTGNYYMRGDEWERGVHFTYIEDGAVRVAQDCGLRIHGISQRNKTQKGLTLYARAEYGAKHFNHRFFGWRQCKKYKRLVLRTFMATQPYSEAGVNNWLCQQLAEPLLCDNMASRPVVLFINGEYWGIYFLEEKPDERWIENNYDIDKELSTVINWWMWPENGTADRWDALYSMLETIDPDDPDDIAWLRSEVDIDALIDYMLLELYITNMDWPTNNVRCWSAPGLRWRWLFFDGDYSMDDRWFDRYDNLTSVDPTDTVPPTRAQSTLLFRRLLANDSLRRHTARRLQQLTSGHLSYMRGKSLLNEIHNVLKDEVPYQTARFGYPASCETWEEGIGNIDDYLARNSYRMPLDFYSYFDITTDSLPLATAEMQIMPNPSGSVAAMWLFADTAGGVMMNIFDMQGRLVHNSYHWLYAGGNAVPLPQMPTGTYFVRIRGRSNVLRWIVR